MNGKPDKISIIHVQNGALFGHREKVEFYNI